ncbi:MAG: hypothetical protein WBG69_03490 [Arcobacteraceae bacterium]
MIFNIVEDENYKEMLEGQIFEVIEYLINKDEEFSITANIEGVQFDPSIPESISANFSHFTLFTLANYTYESIILTEKNITFEAGFGSENFGSHVTIPLYAIFQIVIDESILFLNPTATVEKYFQKKESEEDPVERSMNAFKMNSKNKDLLS